MDQATVNQPLVKQAVFVGSKRLGLEILRTMHVARPDALAAAITFDDRQDTRSYYDGFLAFGNESGVAVHVADTPTIAQDLIISSGATFGVVSNWYWILSAATLSSLTHGNLGIHYSKLPAYRGGSPLVWAMINGDPRVGYSLFQLESGIDTGPLWAQGEVHVDRHDHIADVLDRLEGEVLDCFKTTYTGILTGQVTSKSQPDIEATYCSPRSPEDGRIDWQQPAARVHDFIRAQSTPYPGAFTYCGENRVTIWRSGDSVCTYFGRPGRMVRVPGQGIGVICGDQRAVLIDQIQAGSPVMSADAFYSSVGTKQFRDHPGATPKS